MERLTKVMDKYLSEAKKKVLTLAVSKEWFDMIVSGEKNEEYRVIKDFWMSRLLLIKDEKFKDFDKYDKLHIGKTFEMLIDINTIKEKLNNGTMKFVPFTHVLFKNGYYDDSPKVEKEIESFTIGKPKKVYVPISGLVLSFLLLSLSDMKVKNLPKKIYLNICSNEDEVDYNELNGVTFSTEKVGVTDCDTENVPYVNAASLWHDLKEDKPPLKKWVMFRYSGGGVNPTALHYGAMSDDIWVVTRGDGTQRIEVLYECYDKIEWLDFDELK